MTNASWFLLIGGLLLAMGLTPSLLRRSPITSPIVYLGVGLLAGPTVLHLYHFNPLKESALLEVLTEAAVLISLFSAGLKMPVPFRFARWRAPVLLATASMALSVALVAAFAHWVVGLPIGAAVLLGAIVAPTDPVLATEVQVRHPGDRDELRFTLTSEAGMNDGSAFPFVVLGLGLMGLHDLGDFGARWVVVDVLCATMGGIAVGVVAGAMLARVVGWLRRAPQRHALMDDFLGLGLIGLVYGLSSMLHTWGFLAVFFAAVALRQTELKEIADEGPAPSGRALAEGEAAGTSVSEVASARNMAPMVSTGSLVFKEHLERLSELVLVLLVGGALYVDSWNWPAVAVSLFLFFVARPLSVLLALQLTRTPLRTRAMIGWFGVRGIGSLYYLMYAINHGVPDPLALQLTQVTLIVVTLSIVMHGISVKPLMDLFMRRAAKF